MLIPHNHNKGSNGFFLSKKIAKKPLQQIAPSHIAIIMDGNARWAKARRLSLKIGHKKGAENIENIALASIELGVKFLTIYAFSSENWNRPKDEVEYLMKLLDQYLSDEIKPLMEKGVKILISGNLEKLSAATKERISEIEEITKNNQNLTLNVAFSYGARQEIVDAVKKIAQEVQDEKINPENINEDLIAKNLYNPQIPNPDLLIRTAGDLRVSNFLLWQIAYSELYFTEKYWPDFSKKDLIGAIENFNQRERRYGKR